jgi:hypothetical protein
MKNSLASFCFCLILTCSQAQRPDARGSKNLIQMADSLYKSRDYFKSGQAYAEAFKQQGWKGSVKDRYNAACSWALANIVDSAFSNLQRIAAKGNYANYDHMTTDPDLMSLHADVRWLPLTEMVRSNKDKAEALLNKDLLNQLNEMVKEDQKWRNYWTRFNNKELVNDTTSLNYIQAQVNSTDSINYFKLWQIFITHGFPNYDLAGETGSANFWLLMQHQDKHVKFQEAVLEKMKVEMEKGKASSVNYAYLRDRVNVNSGKLQIYGTQMILNADGTSYVPQPVIEPEKLNERRASVGLDSIEAYIQLMNTHYHGTLKK